MQFFEGTAKDWPTDDEFDSSKDFKMSVGASSNPRSVTFLGWVPLTSVNYALLRYSNLTLFHR